MGLCFGTQKSEQEGFLLGTLSLEMEQFSFDAWEQNPRAWSKQSFQVSFHVELGVHTSDPSTCIDEHVLHWQHLKQWFRIQLDAISSRFGGKARFVGLYQHKLAIAIPGLYVPFLRFLSRQQK